MTSDKRGEDLVSTSLKIRDRSDVLALHFEDLVKYHGRQNIGGLALGFKALQFAFAQVSSDEVPQRERIEIFSAFPGSGAIDAFEMVTRAVTQGRFALDTAFDAPEALEAVSGRFYFRVRHRDRTVAVTPRSGLIPERFLALGRMHRAGEATAEDTVEFQGMKEALAETLMALDAGDIFQVVP